MHVLYYVANFEAGRTMPKDPRTAFISYTRQGGAAAAERVRHLLATNDIKPWQDRTHLRGGEDFWQQIEHAIRRCSYLVMVLTPGFR